LGEKIEERKKIKKKKSKNGNRGGGRCEVDGICPGCYKKKKKIETTTGRTRKIGVFGILGWGTEEEGEKPERQKVGKDQP